MSSYIGKDPNESGTSVILSDDYKTNSSDLGASTKAVKTAFDEVKSLLPDEIPTPATTAPKDSSSVAAIGTSSEYARADHVHAVTAYYIKEPEIDIDSSITTGDASFTITGGVTEGVNATISYFLVSIPELGMVEKKYPASGGTATININIPPETPVGTKLHLTIVPVDNNGNRGASFQKVIVVKESFISTPKIVSPISGSYVSKDFSVVSSEFSSQGIKDTHILSQYRVLDSKGEEISNSGEMSATARHTFSLDEKYLGETVYVEVRYKGSSIGWSDWGRTTYKISESVEYNSKLLLLTNTNILTKVDSISNTKYLRTDSNFSTNKTGVTWLVDYSPDNIYSSETKNDYKFIGVYKENNDIVFVSTQDFKQTTEEKRVNFSNGLHDAVFGGIYSGQAVIMVYVKNTSNYEIKVMRYNISNKSVTYNRDTVISKNLSYRYNNIAFKNKTFYILERYIYNSGQHDFYVPEHLYAYNMFEDKKIFDKKYTRILSSSGSLNYSAELEITEWSNTSQDTKTKETIEVFYNDVNDHNTIKSFKVNKGTTFYSPYTFGSRIWRIVDGVLYQSTSPSGTGSTTNIKFKGYVFDNKNLRIIVFGDDGVYEIEMSTGSPVIKKINNRIYLCGSDVGKGGSCCGQINDINGMVIRAGNMFFIYKDGEVSLFNEDVHKALYCNNNVLSSYIESTENFEGTYTRFLRLIKSNGNLYGYTGRTVYRIMDNSEVVPIATVDSINNTAGLVTVNGVITNGLKWSYDLYTWSDTNLKTVSSGVAPSNLVKAAEKVYVKISDQTYMSEDGKTFFPTNVNFWMNTYQSGTSTLATDGVMYYSYDTTSKKSTQSEEGVLWSSVNTPTVAPMYLHCYDGMVISVLNDSNNQNFVTEYESWSRSPTNIVTGQNLLTDTDSRSTGDNFMYRLPDNENLVLLGTLGNVIQRNSSGQWSYVMTTYIYSPYCVYVEE